MSRYEPIPADIVVDRLDDTVVALVNQFQGRIVARDTPGALFTLLSAISVQNEVIRYLLLKDEADLDILDRIDEFANIRKYPARP